MSIETALVSTLTSDIGRLQPLIDRYGLWALFVACLAEGFGIPLPGQTLLIACALMAAGGHLDILSVVAVAWIGTQLGDVIGYAIGRRGLQRVLNDRVGRGLRLASAARLFDRWGIGLLVAARFLDGIRQTSNLAAGLLGMSWRRFLIGTLAGTSLWVLVFGVGAYYLDRDFQRILDWLRPLGPVALALTLVMAVGLGAVLVGRQRPESGDRKADSDRPRGSGPS